MTARMLHTVQWKRVVVEKLRDSLFSRTVSEVRHAISRRKIKPCNGVSLVSNSDNDDETKNHLIILCVCVIGKRLL